VGKWIRHFRGSAAETTVHPGIGDAPALRGLSFATTTPAAIQTLGALHATAVALDFSADPKELGENVRRAHAAGLQVVLIPAAHFSDANPYPEPLGAVAAAAQAAKVDVLCISWLNNDPDPVYWQGQIAEIRKVFSGQLILGATSDTLPGIEFLEQVDYLGAIGPFDLPSPSKRHPANMHALRTGWACYLDSFESIGNRYGKKAVLLDILPRESTQRNPSEQAMRDEALVTETKGRSAIAGLFLPSERAKDAGLSERIGGLWLSTAPAVKPASEPPEPEADTDP
jgi:hypothetical protein